MSKTWLSEDWQFVDVVDAEDLATVEDSRSLVVLDVEGVIDA